MTQDELIKIWQSSAKQERVKFEKSRLMLDVHSNLERFAKEIRNRDRMDTMSLWFSIPAFAIGAIFVPSSLSKIACLAIAFWSVYLIFKLRKAKRNRTADFVGTYLDYLIATRKKLSGQQTFMHHALYWSVIPFVAFVSLFLYGFMEQQDISLNKTIALAGGTVVLVTLLYFLNKWVVRNQITPRLEKINALIRLLEQEQSSKG
jgi:hypothetical protein